jgi:hypothetical protein
MLGTDRSEKRSALRDGHVVDAHSNPSAQEWRHLDESLAIAEHNAGLVGRHGRDKHLLRPAGVHQAIDRIGRPERRFAVPLRLLVIHRGEAQFAVRPEPPGRRSDLELLVRLELERLTDMQSIGQPQKPRHELDRVRRKGLVKPQAAERPRLPIAEMARSGEPHERPSDDRIARLSIAEHPARIPIHRMIERRPRRRRRLT